MLRTSDGSYQASDHGLTITARLLMGGDRRVNVCLTGDIDNAASDVLSGTVEWLAALAPASVLVDLADVTFACSALPNFVVQILQAVPDGAELILKGASPATGWVLRVTDMAAIATIRHEPAEPGVYRFARSGAPTS